jgi:hypothetical protein
VKHGVVVVHGTSELGPRWARGGGGLGQVMGCRGAPPSMGGDTDVAPCVATIFDVPITRKVGWVIRGTTGLDANMGLTLSLGEEGWGLPEECNTPFL